ncbi:hypothetical protein LTR70_003880 [Exophiala xenobiotica]|uniref:PAC domain-containing protein n=1 Tax=Lithohypha guttulata TaxID=1690604 RepID=A0ABR0KF69_9EURO|nr:hypothetical protein LTR24_003430 [Lithohypha guttulata]KAK5322199.1 hypothetical protein LTR70_003880 [Exophiala xenobiotica]
MDLERIKQNFRIRSGRNKQHKKKPKPTTVSVPSGEQQQHRPNLPNGHSSTPEAPKEDTHEEQDELNDQPQEDQQVNEQEQAQDSSNDAHEHPVDQILEATHETQNTVEAASNSVQQETEQLESNSDQQNMAEVSSETEDFDLNPPKPRSKPPSLETISELLFSSGHLDSLLHHPPQLARFSAFLQKYIPHYHPLLAQYLETQKAIKAVAYANAVAEGLKPKDTGEGTTTETRRQAATLDSEFEAISNASFRALVGDALPTFISFSLVKIVSECLTNEITGRSTPVMRDLVEGLSEVFCLTDPNQEDNPIIYASEEFYRLTRYGPEDTLNSNCRFLQGRKTNPDSPKRLKAAIQKGEEINETLLNYRRDGRPFLNLLMVAPLHDRNGKLKYHIGAQVDVTGLVEGGRVLEGFQRYLHRRDEDQKKEEREKAQQDLDDDQRRKKRALARLRDLSETFDLEESGIIQANSRANSLSRDDDDTGSIGSVERRQRRVFGDSDASDVDDENESQQPNEAAAWELGQAGDGRLSGKLPGVYDSFMLLRPAPSLRIVFVSPKLRRIGNVLQTPFLSHVAAPEGTLRGLAESLKSGVPVSAKIHFTSERGKNRDGTQLTNGTKHEDGKNGKAIWVSCTPLIGVDDRVGVWMCVVVEKSRVGTITRRRESEMEKQTDHPVQSIEDANAPSKRHAAKPDDTGKHSGGEDAPIKPVRIDSDTVMTREQDNRPDEGNTETSDVKEHEDQPDEAEAVSPDNERSAKSIRQMQSVYFDAHAGQEPESMKSIPENEESAEGQESEVMTTVAEDGTSMEGQTPESMQTVSGDESSAKGQEPESMGNVPDDQRSAKSIRQMKSVYFDAYGGQEPVHEPVSVTTDSERCDEPTSQPTESSEADGGVGSQQSTTHDYEYQVADSPGKGLAKPDEDSGTDSVQLPDHPPANVHQDSGDERVNTRVSPPREEQDSRQVRGEDINAISDTNTNGSSSEGARPQGSQSPPPAQAPARHTTPPIPSSAQPPDEREDRGQDDDVETPRQPRYARPIPSSDKDDESEHKSDIKTTPTSLMDPYLDQEVSQDEHEHDMDDSTATIRALSQDRNQSPSENEDQANDSEGFMETPQKAQPTLRLRPSRSSSPEMVKQPPQSEGEEVEEQKHQHEHDVQNWVENARPPSSKHDPKVEMDYLVAGNNRWPLGLGHDVRKWEDDRSTAFDDSLLSPYSVD